MWISGPITTVHDEHICHIIAAVARVGLETVGLEIERGLSDKCMSAAGVLGNQPLSVSTTHSSSEQ
jgi:hypothetical protein